METAHERDAHTADFIRIAIEQKRLDVLRCGWREDSPQYHEAKGYMMGLRAVLIRIDRDGHKIDISI